MPVGNRGTWILTSEDGLYNVLATFRWHFEVVADTLVYQEYSTRHETITYLQYLLVHGQFFFFFFFFLSLCHWH